MTTRVVTCKTTKQQKAIYKEYLVTSLSKTALAAKHNISTRTLGRIIANHATQETSQPELPTKLIEISSSKEDPKILELTDQLQALTVKFNSYVDKTDRYITTLETAINEARSTAIDRALRALTISARVQTYSRGTYGHGSTDLRVSLLYKGVESSYGLCSLPS